LSNDIGRQVDVRVFYFDAIDRHTYGVAYPSESLNGVGVIDGEPVECIAARSMYQIKTAYEPAAKGRADIRELRRLLS
jgi:lincosamide nucleotidyltransferase A/C/D/E